MSEIWRKDNGDAWHSAEFEHWFSRLLEEADFGKVSLGMSAQELIELFGDTPHRRGSFLIPDAISMLAYVTYRGTVAFYFEECNNSREQLYKIQEETSWREPRVFCVREFYSNE